MLKRAVFGAISAFRVSERFERRRRRRRVVVDVEGQQRPTELQEFERGPRSSPVQVQDSSARFQESNECPRRILKECSATRLLESTRSKRSIAHDNQPEFGQERGTSGRESIVESGPDIASEVLELTIRNEQDDE